MEEGSNGLGEVTASVILDSDLTWTAYVGDKKVPDTCNVLARFQSSPLTDDKLSDMIKAIDNAVLCPGNPDEKFVSACKDKGGCVRGARGNGDVVAFIDKSSVTDHSGNQYQCTVRGGGGWIVTCYVRDLASTHYAANHVSRQDQRFAHRSLVKVMSDSHTSASSHTRYRDLTPAEKDKRMKNLHRALKVSN